MKVWEAVSGIEGIKIFSEMFDSYWAADAALDDFLKANVGVETQVVLHHPNGHKEVAMGKDNLLMI